YKVFPFNRVDETKIERIVLSSEGILSARHRPWRRRSLYREWMLDTVPAQLDDLAVVIDRWRPDVIVTDPPMWGPVLFLHEPRRLPVAVLSLIPACHLSGRDAPILGVPLPRATSPIARLRSRVLRTISDRALGDLRRRASALRVSHGLTPLAGSVTDLAGQLPLYLVPGSREFDYLRDDLPASVHYVGPCVWTSPSREPAPAWLDELPANQPLVYVSEGTINLKPRVLRAAA